jgi:hypothetical protein
MSDFRQSLRLDSEIIAAIDKSRQKDLRHLSRNSWIEEAIIEKLNNNKAMREK